MGICAEIKKRPWTRVAEGDRLPLPSGEGEGASCWICFGEEPSESGEPLRRDCSCRGGSGHAHISCIAGYAEEHNRRWDGCYIEELARPWSVCPICHQEYQNELAVDLAARFVTFAEVEHPGDQSRLLEALLLQLAALAEQRASHGVERKQAANRILSAIELMRTQNRTLPQRASLLEAEAHNGIGRVHLLEGTEEGAKRAVENFEKGRDILRQIGNAIGAAAAAVAESNIAIAKSNINGSIASRASHARKQRELYEQNVVTFGDGSRHAIQSGLILADALFAANRGIEAEGLLAELVAASRRSHGPRHRVTRAAACRLRSHKIKRATGWLRMCILVMFIASIVGIAQILFRWHGPNRGWTGEEIKREIERVDLGTRAYLVLALVVIALEFYADSL